MLHSCGMALAFLPCPCATQDGFQIRVRRAPSQFVLKALRASAQHRRISQSARAGSHFDVFAEQSLGGSANFSDGIAPSCSDVVRAKSRLARLPQSQTMGLGNIQNVYVIT